MNDRRLWQPDGHASTPVLMLYLDGELGEHESAVTKHLRHCWACRERLEWLNRGVLTFLDYYRHVLAAGLETGDVPNSGLQVLRQELARPAEPGRLHVLAQRILSAAGRVPLPAWVTTMASVSLFILLPYLYVVEPSRLTAKDFLQRACAVSMQSATKTTLAAHRIIRIRRGQRVYDRKTTSAAKPDPETLAELKLAGVDWENPLSPRDFAAWHESAVNPKDVIRESQTSITLETTLPAGAPVRLVSFTVDRGDWHPTANHIEVPSQPPIDIDELPWQPEPPAPVDRSAARKAPREASAYAELAPDAPSAEQLDDTEVRLREVLRDLQGDFYAAPVIRREPQRIGVMLFVASAERSREISGALGGIPFLAANVMTPDSAAPESASAAQQPASPAGPPQVLRAPLADRLRRYCGGLDQANSYLAAMAESHSETMMAASALRDLAARYSVNDWNRLPPGLRARLDHLVGDYESRLLRGARSYDALASPVLDAMLRELDVPPAAPERASPACCLTWREEVPMVSDQVQRIQTILNRLFAGTASGPSGAVESPKALLAACDRARAQLKESLSLASGKDSSQGQVP